MRLCIVVGRSTIRYSHVSSTGRLERTLGFTTPIASAEDIIIANLEWYRLDNEASERQWQDITDVLKLLGDAANLSYLREFALSVGVGELLERLLSECGCR